MENKILELLHGFVVKKINHNASAQLFCFSGLSFELAERLVSYVQDGHPILHNDTEIGLYVFDPVHRHIGDEGVFLDEAGAIRMRNDASHHFVLLTSYGSGTIAMSMDTAVETIGISEESYAGIEELTSTELYRELVNFVSPSNTDEGKYIQGIVREAIGELLQTDGLYVTAVWDFLSGICDVAQNGGIGVSTAEAFCGCPCSAGLQLNKAAKGQRDFYKQFKETISDTVSFDELFNALLDAAEEGRVQYSVEQVNDFRQFVETDMPKIDKTPYLAVGEKYRTERTFHTWWPDITLQEIVKIIHGNEEKSALQIEAIGALCGSTVGKKQPIVFADEIVFSVQSQLSCDDTLYVRKGKSASTPIFEEPLFGNEGVRYQYETDEDDRKKGKSLKLFFNSRQTRKSFSYDVMPLPSIKAGMHMTIKDEGNLYKIKPFKVPNKKQSKTYREEITVSAPGDVMCQLFVNDTSRIILTPVEYEDAQGEKQYFNFQKERGKTLEYTFRINVFNELHFKFKGFTDGVEYTYEVVFYVKETKSSTESSETFYDEHVRRNLLRRNGPVPHSEHQEVELSAGRDIYALERVIITEATSGNGGYPIVIADDYRKVLLSSEKPDLALPFKYTETPFGSGVDTRPDFARWKQSADTYGMKYREARQKLFTQFETDYPEKRIEEIDLSHATEEFEGLVVACANAYKEWLEADYVNAAIADTIWVYATRDNQSLAESPSQVIVPPTHPLRLAWQLWAQKLMAEAESKCPSSAVSIFDSDAVPDMISLPIASIGARDAAVRFMPMFSVKSSSRYWGVLHSYEALASGVKANDYLWKEQFGLVFEQSSRTITKEQVESALNDAREMCMAKPSLSISFNGTSAKGICREGILDWNRQFIEEDNEQINQLGPRRLKIYDVGGKHLPSNETIAAISDQSEGAIQWFAPERIEEQMDLSIATLSAHDSKVRESKLGDSVTAAGGLACYRSRQLCNGSYVIESRKTTAASDWRENSDPLQKSISAILSGMAHPAGVEITDSHSHIGFPTDIKALVANEKASYYAVSSADVDHACFVSGGGGEAYLWDYRLPQGNLGSRNTEGFYLLARETPVMFKAVAKAIASISGGSSTVPEQVIANTLHLTAQRGIPTIKDLTLGGTKALGEVGILVAVSVLQGDITDSISKGLFPPYCELDDRAWLNFVVPFDPFRRQFEALVSGTDKKVRPDLACISVCCSKDDNGLIPESIKFSFLEVKTRTGRFSDTEKVAALEQYSTCYRILLDAITSEKFSLHTLAVYDFLVGLFTFGFRVYGTFNGVDNLKLEQFYTDVVHKIFSNRDFVKLEKNPRLLVVDAGDTMASDKRQGVYCTMRINGGEACKAIAKSAEIPVPDAIPDHWAMLAPPAEEEIVLPPRNLDDDGDDDVVIDTPPTPEPVDEPQPADRTSNTEDVADSVDTISQEVLEEIEEVRDSLLLALNEARIRADLIGEPKIAPNSFVFTFSGRQASMQPAVIQNKATDFKVHHGIEILRVVAKRLKVCVHVKREHRESIMWPKYWPRVESECRNQRKLFIGVAEEDGRYLFLDPVTEHGPHTLVAGATKSGKSVLLRNLLYSIGEIYSPLESRIILIDPKKGQDYFAFDGMPHFYGSDADTVWIGTQPRASVVLQDLVREMERRVEILTRARCEDLKQYQEKIADPMSPDWIPRLWVFHDEFAMWMLDRDYKHLVENTISQLAVMARSAGIHLVFATQRPSAEVVSVQTRNNLGNRLILKVSDEGTSNIAIGRPGAESLLGGGHILIRREGEDGDDAVEGQVAFHDKVDVEKGVKRIIEKYSGLVLPDAMVINR